MKKLCFFSFLALYVVTCFPPLGGQRGASQSLQWAAGMGGTGTDYGYSVTTDASGNVYTTGYFEGTMDFDPGVGTANLQAGKIAEKSFLYL